MNSDDDTVPMDDEDQKPPGLHRDDLDFELAEEVVQELQRLHPGYKVSFVGDQTDISEELKQQMSNLDMKMGFSVIEGRCFDCGKQIPGFDVDLWAESDQNDLPEGWSMYNVSGGGPHAPPCLFICQDCDDQKGGSECLTFTEM